MSESRSPIKGALGLHEPINSLSAIIGLVLTISSHNSHSNFLKVCIGINLIAAFFAHATYNFAAIKLDAITMVVPIIHVFISNFWVVELYLLLSIVLVASLLIKRILNLIFAIGLCIIVCKKYNDVIDYDNFMLAIIICILSAVSRLLDSIFCHYEFYNLWYLHLHAVWHIGMTTGLLYLIDSVKW